MDSLCITQELRSRRETASRLVVGTHTRSRRFDDTYYVRSVVGRRA